jgi:hypothetical protein
MNRFITFIEACDVVKKTKIKKHRYKKSILYILIVKVKSPLT